MFQVVPGLGPTSITTNFLNWEDSMSLIKTVKYEEAQGEVKEVYDAVKAVAQTVPKPLQMASISPGLLKIQGQILQYYLNHPPAQLPTHGPHTFSGGQSRPAMTTVSISMAVF